jgi:drug/metabolite transporter (DMT)-like permease
MTSQGTTHSTEPREKTTLARMTDVPTSGPGGHGRLPAATGLALGVGGTAWAAIFFRLADDAPALTIAGYRLVISSAVIGVAALALLLLRRDRLPVPRDLPWLGASGLFLAAHFWTWFVSLERTSVGSSVLIVGMQPLLSALIAFALLRERPNRAEWWGIALAVAGLAIIGGRDFAADPGQLWGDFLALAAGIFGALYRTIGRSVRAEISTTSYSAVVYCIAAIALWASIGAVRPQTTGFDGETWTFIVLLALVPQVIGHTAFNWALAHYRVVTVGIAGLGEPILATLLAIPILGENPSAGVVVGGPLIVAGVLVGIRGAGMDPAPSRRPIAALEPPTRAPPG